MKKIPSIYNYCDRWCERCPFTARCAVYESESKLTEEAKDVSNQAYWDHVGSNLKKSLDLLHKTAEKFGVDLNNIPREEEEEIVRLEQLKRTKVKEHELVILSEKYGSSVKLILDNEEFWNRVATDLIAEFNTGLTSGEKAARESDRLAEAREVIGWYAFFISLKFNRALGEKYDTEFENSYEPDMFNEDSLQTDGNGSAKVALIASERSLTAWQLVFELIPDEDRILPLLATLQRIQRLGREEFPEAYKFRRPGFDTHRQSSKS
jgi:hypothetical protein